MYLESHCLSPRATVRASVRAPQLLLHASCHDLQVDTIPIWSPERGKVGERIFRDADDERNTKEISIEDTAYWFAENNGELQLRRWGSGLD